MTDRKNWDLYPDDVREHSPLAPTRTRPVMVGIAEERDRLREFNAALLAACKTYDSPWAKCLPDGPFSPDAPRRLGTATVTIWKAIRAAINLAEEKPQ